MRRENQPFLNEKLFSNFRSCHLYAIYKPGNGKYRVKEYKK